MLNLIGLSIATGGGFLILNGHRKVEHAVYSFDQRLELTLQRNGVFLTLNFQIKTLHVSI